MQHTPGGPRPNSASRLIASDPFMSLTIKRRSSWSTATPGSDSIVAIPIFKHGMPWFFSQLGQT